MIFLKHRVDYCHCFYNFVCSSFVGWSVDWLPFLFLFLLGEAGGRKGCLISLYIVSTVYWNLVTFA